ncbi:MAG: hypothetical protein PCFJNLEI_04236 [Verrucomicrobiae bacterium]|nr:hypothetical protein [Verrucomicrobiae bacterium]
MQADPIFSYGEAGAADIELIDSRTRALRPAIARLFVDVRWFNPSLDGQTFDWDNRHCRNLCRQVELLAALGTRINLVLFKPHELATKLVDAMVALIERLPGIGWLTLFNEPDSLFVHDSPLARKVFPGKPPRWDDFVKLSRYTSERLPAGIRLATPDCVWGHPMRVERMELAVRDLADLDVAFSYHNYSPEWPDFPAPPEFTYPGVVAETKLFRQMIGPERELIVWETNAAGIHFTNLFPGVGLHGEDLLGSLDTAVELTAKLMAMLNHGVDGICLWCLSDGVYLPFVKPGEVMEFGLWRDKRHGWEYRPYAHYFTALCHAFRPGMQLLRVENDNVLAARAGNQLTVAVLNDTLADKTVHLDLPSNGTRLIIRPGTFGKAESQPFTPPLTLAGRELSILTFDER